MVWCYYKYIYIHVCILQCITVLHSDSVWRCASICSAVLSAVVAELVFRSSVRGPGLRITFSWQASPNCKETWGKSVCVVSCAGTCSYKQIHNWAVRRVNSTTCSLCNDHEIRRPLHLSSRCFLDEFCFQIIYITDLTWEALGSEEFTQCFPEFRLWAM